MKQIIPLIYFLSAFVFLTLFVFKFSSNSLSGDEQRYLEFADNITKGYFAKKDLNPGFLWNGPGYPLILSIFIKYNASYVAMRLINVFYIIFALYFLYKSLRFHFNKIPSLIFTSLCLLDPNHFISIPRILTEAQTFFLISFCLYTFIQLNNKRTLKTYLLFTIVSGFLILTKIFFAYVFFVLLVIALIIFRNKHFIYLTTFPFIFCLPYLTYTYSITGKYFYWADSGGSSLYSMSTPYNDEYGDWFPPRVDKEKKVVNYQIKNSLSTIPKPGNHFFGHYHFLDSISMLTGVEKDKALKDKAIKNIFNYPLKYLKNIAYNYSRVFFRSPFTNRELKRNFKIIFFSYGIILISCLITIVYNIYNKKINNQFVPFFLFMFIYIGGLGLVSSDSRFIYPMIPIIVFLFFTLQKDSNQIKIINNKFS